MNPVKRLAADAIWAVSSHSPALRRVMKPLGLRTPYTSYGGRVGSFATPDGRVVKLTHLERNYMSFELHWKGWEYYEPVTSLLLSHLAKQSATFFDVGANIGYFTLIAAAGEPAPTIHCFEPNPKLNPILNENLRVNGFAATAQPLAVSASSGTMDMYVPTSDMSASLEAGFNAGESVRVEKIQTVSLDDYVDAHQIQGPLLMKVDVEGHEPGVIAGAHKVLETIKPDMVLEVTEDAPWTQEHLDYFHGLGYRFHLIAPSGFVESDDLGVQLHGQLEIRNRFVTTRPADEVRALHEHLRPRIEQLDMSQSCLWKPNQEG
jgi:FkbM family methyltransferase